MKSGELLIPPFDRTIAGTTAIRLIEYANDYLIPNGIIKGIKREYIKLADAKKQAAEVMILGGNTCVPVLKWDNEIITEKPGPITMIIQKFFNEIDSKDQKDAQFSTDISQFSFIEEIANEDNIVKKNENNRKMFEQFIKPGI